MTTQKLQQSTISRADSLIANDSRNELKLYKYGDQEYPDARDVHQKLKVKTKFSDWIKDRIERFGFEPNKDFISTFASEISEAKNGRGGHNSLFILLTWDMAKELCLLENNEEGRKYRRYFIEAEKKWRGITSLGKERELLKGLKPRKINDRMLWPYREVLTRTGYNTNSGGSRRHRYWGQFVKEGHLLYCTDFIVSMLYTNRQAMNRRAEALQAQPVLPLNFGETPKGLAEKKGGRHD